MRTEWPPDFFPDIDEPSKTLCVTIMDTICSSDEGRTAFCNLRWDSYTLATMTDRPELSETKVRYDEAKAIIAQIVGEDNLTILLRAFAADVDH